MSDEEITLPPLPHRALRPGAGDDAMREFARAAVLLDRQQRAAPSAEPVAWIESPHGAIRANPLYRLDPPPQSLAWRIPLYTTPPDHREAMQQALEALIKARDTTYSDTLYPQFEVAIDALRAAMEEKR